LLQVVVGPALFLVNLVIPARATQMLRTGFVLALVSIAVVFVLARAIGRDATNEFMPDGALIDINAE
jgi:hypothetical protein